MDLRSCSVGFRKFEPQSTRKTLTFGELLSSSEVSDDARKCLEQESRRYKLERQIGLKVAREQWKQRKSRK